MSDISKLSQLRVYQQLARDIGEPAQQRGVRLLAYCPKEAVAGEIYRVPNGPLKQRALLCLSNEGEMKARAVRNDERKTFVPVLTLNFRDMKCLTFVFPLHKEGWLGVIINAHAVDRYNVIEQYIDAYGKHSPYPRCAFCDSITNGRRKCGACRAAIYCDRTCQKRDWRTHQCVCCFKKP